MQTFKAINCGQKGKMIFKDYAFHETVAEKEKKKMIFRDYAFHETLKMTFSLF